MKSATYDNQTGEISSPMDAYIKEVEEIEKELNLESKAIKEKDRKKNQEYQCLPNPHSPTTTTSNP